MSERYAHVLAMLQGAVWVIQPEKLAAIREVIRLRVSGGGLSDTEIRERLALGPDEEMPRAPRPAKMAGVAVLPLYGFLCPKANMVTEYSGGTSLESFQRAYRAALADPAAGSIVLDVDSPGGLSYGVEETWDLVYGARKQKRTVAVVSPSAGSGAYWIATAAEEIVITPSGDAGSVGAYTMHEDLTAALEAEGVKLEIIRAQASPRKVEANPFEPLTEDARAYAQAQVDEVMASFVKAVAKGRGVSPAAVVKGFGGGRMVMARAAVAAGMADRVGTLDEVIGRLAGRKPAPAGTRAAATLEPGMYTAEELASAIEVAEEPPPADTGEAERERLRVALDLIDARRKA